MTIILEKMILLATLILIQNIFNNFRIYKIKKIMLIYGTKKIKEINKKIITKK